MIDQLRQRILRVEKMLFHLLYQQDVEFNHAKGDPATRRPEVVEAYTLSQAALKKLCAELKEVIEQETAYQELRKDRPAPAEPPKERGQLLEID